MPRARADKFGSARATVKPHCFRGTRREHRKNRTRIGPHLAQPWAAERPEISVLEIGYVRRSELSARYGMTPLVPTPVVPEASSWARNPPNGLVDGRRQLRPLYVDSSRSLRANDGYSKVAWRTVQIDPTPLFVDAVRAVIMWRFESIDPATCVADWRGPGAGASMEGVDRYQQRAARHIDGRQKTEGALRRRRSP